MERTTLVDADGVVGRYDPYERDGHRYADLFDRDPGVSVERAREAVLAQFGGMRIAADEPLGRSLMERGGRLLRHAHLMSHDLRERPDWDAPPGYRLTEVDRPAADLLDAYRAAFPLGHVDFRDEPPETTLGDLESHLAGRDFGPLLRGSGLAVAPDGTVAGAILLGVLPGEPPLNGPWVIELFRDPAHRGVGRPLLDRALALVPVSVLGLIVSEGNPARWLYEDAGFRVVSTRLVVQLAG